MNIFLEALQILQLLAQFVPVVEQIIAAITNPADAQTVALAAIPPGLPAHAQAHLTGYLTARLAKLTTTTTATQ